MLTLTVPVPPSLNNAYTNGRGHGRRVLTSAGRGYKEHIADQVLKTSSLGWAREPPARSMKRSILE